MEKIGFVGLGNMGGPMCTNLLRSGHDVSVFDVNPAAIYAQVEEGATAANSAVELAEWCDVLMTSLPRPDHVAAVMDTGGALDAMSPGSIWVDLTTNRVEVITGLAARASQCDVAVVDCPVTGAVDGARTASLTLFIGGAPEDVARVTPLLENLGTVIACGPLGTGNVVKLVTNQLWFIHAAAIGEGFAVGLAHGVDLGVLYSAIQQSVGDSFVARHDAPSIFAGHYDPSFSLDLCMKDLGLIGELADQVDARLVMTEAATDAFADATQRYGSDQGELHVARRLEDDAGLSFRLDGDWTPHWEK